MSSTPLLTCCVCQDRAPEQERWECLECVIGYTLYSFHKKWCANCILPGQLCASHYLRKLRQDQHNEAKTGKVIQVKLVEFNSL